MKQLFTLLIALGITAIAFGQGRTTSDVVAGLRGGLNVSSIAGDQSSQFSLKPGFSAGLFTEFRVGERGGLFLDLLYSQKGANFEESQQRQGLSDARLRLDYIDVPIAFIFYPVETFGLYAGPQVSMLATTRLKNSAEAVDYKAVVRSTDYGVVAGFRLRPAARVFFDLRYNYNFTDMSELDLLFLGDNNTRDSNHVAMLTFGYALFMRE